MIALHRKYNPGFLTDEELVASFCVRTHEFDSMFEMLRDCGGSANPHRIVIGPRGSGKTNLLLRVAAEIRRDADLSSRFFPIIFAEESYEVASAGEFWLEALSRLSAQAPDPETAEALRRTWQELRTVADDRSLGDRCLGALLDFADSLDKRLVLVAENLNAMFADMGDAEDAGWRLRNILQTEPRILLLASATSRFDEIDNPDRALYDLFRVVTLRPLDDEECAVLWESVSGRRRAPETIRALRILTGGSPRLLAIVARFGAELSFRELMAELLDLVDDHTEYFKSHLESLPAQERRVYLALAALWKPANAREIADRARLDTSKCSAQLTRLAHRGAVEVTGGSPRRKLYYVTERLYNIYYLMRRASGPDPLIEALIRFMASYYAPEELKDIGARIAREATGLDAAMQGLHRSAFVQLASLPALETHLRELLDVAPPDFVADFVQTEVDREVPASLEGAWALLDKACSLAEQNRLEEALVVCDDAVRLFVNSESEPSTRLEMVAVLHSLRATILAYLDRSSDALAAYDEAVEGFERCGSPDVLDFTARCLYRKGTVLEQLGRREQAIAVYGEVERRFAESDSPNICRHFAEAVTRKGFALGHLERWEDALAAFEEAIHRFETSDERALMVGVAMAFFGKGVMLSKLERFEEALAAMDAVTSRLDTCLEFTNPEFAVVTMLEKGNVLLAWGRPEAACAAWNDVVRGFGGSQDPEIRFYIACALLNRADVELTERRYGAAVEIASTAVEQHGNESVEIRWRSLVVRAAATLANGNPTACEQDVASILKLLPSLGVLPQEILEALKRLSLDLGPERMRELIVASPSAELMLPLTTALERELGIEYRVAREVEEVAEDIQRDFANLREEAGKEI